MQCPTKSLPKSIHTSQPLIMSILQHNLTELPNIFFCNISWISFIKSEHPAFSCPLSTIPYSACLDLHFGSVFAHFRACSHVRLCTCPAFWLTRLHVSVSTSCSDFGLTLEKKTWDRVSPVIKLQRWQYTYPYTRTSKRLNKKDSFRLFSPSLPTFLSQHNLWIVIVFFCFRFPTKASSGSPLNTCSGRVAVISPGDIVHILDDREYRLFWVNAHSATVVLRRVDPFSKGSYLSSSNQSSFMRLATSVCLLPSSTHDASVKCNEPTDNCMCNLTPPPVLPDVRNDCTHCNLTDACTASTQCDFETDLYAAFKCFRFDSVDRLIQGFEEAKLSQIPRSKSFVTKSTQ